MDYAVNPAQPALLPNREGERGSSLPSMSDGELLVAIADGSREAFEELHGRYRGAMLGLAVRALHDHGHAEDAVQEVWTSIWKAAGSYRPDLGAGAPWIFAVARNAFISRWRKRSLSVVEMFDEPSTEPGPPEQAEQAWRSFSVHRALEALPHHQRQLIELAYWGELSQSEIAERLDLPLGTVKTRTRAALRRLNEALKGDMQ
jgi:RNA polymerase sigma-70 factor (ECF subfamily)